MKHKLLTFLLAIIASVGTMFAETYSGACGENLTWSLNTEDGVLTISGTGEMDDYQNATQTPWNGYSSLIQSVIMNDNVMTVGNYAFAFCSNLKNVSLNQTLTTIGEHAFFSCPLLELVVIPDNVIVIGYNAFAQCSWLTSVRIGNKVTTIGKGAFARCGRLSSVVMFNSVTSIGENAFDNCSALTTINIPNSITSIVKETFAFCAALTSIEIPGSVTSIGENAFYGCSGLTSVTNKAVSPQTINANVFTNINFSSCTLYVPAESVEAYKAADVWKEFGNIVAIGSEPEESNYATIADIYNMAADSAFTLGAFDVVYVPSFQNGSNMYIKDASGSCVIYKPSYGLKAGDHVEAGLQGKVSIYHGLHEIAPVSTKEELTITSGEAPAPMEATEVPSATNVNQYVVYNGVSFSTDTAFVEGRRHMVYGTWNGQTITFYNQYYIGATLTTGKTYNITAVNTVYGTTPQAYPLAVEEVSSVTPDFCIIASGTCGAEGDNLTWTLSCDSVLTISGTGTMADYNWTTGGAWYSNKESIKSVIIENGVTSIGVYAFKDCHVLSSVTISNTVTSIEYGAFYECNSLRSIVIPNSVTSIGGSAFVGSALTSVTFPNSIIYIGNTAFYECNNLVYVEIPGSVVEIGSNAFAICSALTSINVAVDNPNYCSIDGILFNKEKTLIIQYPARKAETTYYIPNTVTSIGSSAFFDCYNLTSVTIPNSVTSIGEECFAGCSSLTSVTIPNSVTSIGLQVFAGCLSLATIEIPNSITSIGEGAFLVCTGLTSLVIPNSVTSIRERAFRDCSGLISITNYATTPQIINANVFDGMDKSSCTLYVPAESVEAYKAADVWKEFTNILPIGESVEADTITVAQALEIGSGLEVGASTDKQYTIRGYVSAITTPFSEQYLNQTFYIADDSLSTASSNAEGGFYVYRGKPITGQPIKEGALVELTTAIKNYNNRTIENAEQNVLVMVLEEGPECRILSGTCGENLTWTLNTCDSILTIIGTGKMWDAPDLGWLSRAQKIKTVIIQDGVKNIGVDAFADCINLQSVSIPETVDSIGQRAFMHCTNLQTVNMPNSVRALGHKAFVGCNNLTDPVHNARIFGYMPRYYSGSYSIPEGIVSVAAYSFTECNNLKEIIIPSSVEILGLNSLVVPNLKKIMCLAVTPPICVTTVFKFYDEQRGGVISVNTSIPVYVPKESVEAYKAADQWKEFFNILPIDGTVEPMETVEGNYTVYYEDKDSQNLSNEVVTLHVPVAPVIEGFTFVEWRVAEGSLASGITIQAVYTADEPTAAPAVYTNPANSAQKLIRNGNVYILTEKQIYTITGQKIQSY